MTSPITGPFVTTDYRLSDSGNAYNLYRRRERWRQQKPHNEPLPYEYYYAHTLTRDNDNTSCTEWRRDSSPDQQAHTIAYERFKAEISSRAEGGVFLAEANQAVAMISARARQLLEFTRAVRRWDLPAAYGSLKVTTPIVRRINPKLTENKKLWANNYLEFHFGWVPLVEDIYNAVDVLQNPFKTVFPKSSATVRKPEVHNPPIYPFSRGTREFTVSKVRLGANVRVNNPNLWLANQLGVINPLTVAWELVPFSFVVDWFANVGQFLGSGTDFCGLSLEKGYTTSSQETLFQVYWSNYSWTSEHHQLRLRRSVGISAPTIGLRPAKIWGWRRAAAAVSLLVQSMK